jgi:hypothetical protein
MTFLQNRRERETRLLEAVKRGDADEFRAAAREFPGGLAGAQAFVRSSGVLTRVGPPVQLARGASKPAVRPRSNGGQRRDTIPHDFYPRSLADPPRFTVTVGASACETMRAEIARGRDAHLELAGSLLGARDDSVETGGYLFLGRSDYADTLAVRLAQGPGPKTRFARSRVHLDLDHAIERERDLRSGIRLAGDWHLQPGRSDERHLPSEPDCVGWLRCAKRSGGRWVGLIAYADDEYGLTWPRFSAWVAHTEGGRSIVERAHFREEGE